MNPNSSGICTELTEELISRPNVFQLWWRILKGVTTTAKELQKANQVIIKLEQGDLAGELVATRALKKLEQTIIRFGDTDKSPRTMRHELLAILDKEYYQEVERDPRG